MRVAGKLLDMLRRLDNNYAANSCRGSVYAGQTMSNRNEPPEIQSARDVSSRRARARSPILLQV
jgi:hypothetical protein